MFDGLHMHIENGTKKALIIALCRAKRGLRGMVDWGNVTNGQYKPNHN
jgi:hypothetical protein